MAYKYMHFIPQNTAPSGAKHIGVYDNSGKKVCTIRLGGLSRPTSEKLYSFGLVSDIHLYPLAAVEWTPEKKFRNALTYFQKIGCIMCLQCGDITQTGFYAKDSTTQEITFDDTQMMEYKTIREEYTIPVYGICGNHESYYSKNVSDHPDEVEEVMGKRELSFTISSSETSDKNEQVLEVGDDIFILLGQPSATCVVSDSDLQWLYETLEANRNKRCFVFVHAYIEEDSGDPMDVRENSIFDMWSATKKSVFMNLMKHYKNVILFHGHSHMKFENQEFDKNSNYTDRNNFKSIHIPSLGVPRDINFETNKSEDDRYASQGYIVDVHDDCIVLTGMDLINNKCIPIGIYKIDTPLMKIAAGTFTDSTGTIVT